MLSIADDHQAEIESLTEFAFRKVEMIAERADERDRKSFWNHLSSLVSQRGRGRLGRRIADLKLDLARSQRANATAHAELSFARERFEKELNSCEGDVRILRSVLTQALDCMHAARFNRPWRHNVDEVMARTRMALRNTERKPKLGADPAVDHEVLDKEMVS